MREDTADDLLNGHFLDINIVNGQLVKKSLTDRYDAIAFYSKLNVAGILGHNLAILP